MDCLALIIAWVIITGQYAAGQIDYNPFTNSLICSKARGTYCDGESLATATVIFCASASVAEIHSCNIELSHILPDGYKDAARCYQISEGSGDAVCAFNGTGYTLDGFCFSLPETLLSNLNANASGPIPDISSWKTVLVNSLSGSLPLPPTDTPSSAPSSAATSSLASTRPMQRQTITHNEPSSLSTPIRKTPGSANQKTTILFSSYGKEVFPTTTIPITLQVTKAVSSLAETLSPLSTVTMAVSDTRAPSVSSSIVKSTVFRTLTPSSPSPTSTTNAARGYPGQAALVAVLAFAAAVF